MSVSTRNDPQAALESYPQLRDRRLTFLADGGLINKTWAVGEPPAFALQQVNAIFPPAVHERILLVTRRLVERGVDTPLLISPVEGGVTVPGPAGTVWRVLTWVPGRTHHVMPSPAHAHGAARLVARFHDALLGLEDALEPLREGVHDTERHMAALRQALQVADGHRLEGPVRALGGSILQAWVRLRQRGTLAGLPLRPAHGDLKISNVRFDEQGERPLCLLDLDTLGRFTLAEELGDALRSWCNPHGEDEPQPEIDMEVFRAAVDGYLSAAPFVTPAERVALVPGFARIPLELAARFCADAIHEAYFGWDPARAAGRGEHNLLRARGQLGLAREVESRWGDLQRIVGTGP